jgi:DNA-binding XRE family transcriptional regulator
LVVGLDERRRGDEVTRVSDRRHETAFPGFAAMAARRRVLTDELVARRLELGLTQTQVAATMGTSQSAVARLEAGDGDVRLSTLERYAAALGGELRWHLGAERPKGSRR